MALKDFKEQVKDFLRTDEEKASAQEKENEAYRVVAEELAAGERDLGAWTKAFADSGGNEKAAEVLYIERMVKLKELQGRRAAQEWAEVMQEQLEEEARRKQQTEQDHSGTDTLDIGLFLYVLLAVAALVFIIVLIDSA
tara:strand:+ start:67 stop:483 length:417 start_codon:yes stop_codon:yes gene_type:complete